MTYKELKVGDLFIIEREHNNVVYKKMNTGFLELNTKRIYNNLNGQTKVKLIKKRVRYAVCERGGVTPIMVVETFDEAQKLIYGFPTLEVREVI